MSKVAKYILSLCLIFSLLSVPCSQQVTTSQLFGLIGLAKTAPPNCSLFQANVCTKCNDGFFLSNGECKLLSSFITLSIPNSAPVGSSSIGNSVNSSAIFNQNLGANSPQITGTLNITQAQPSKSFHEEFPTKVPTDKNLPCAPKPFCG